MTKHRSVEELEALALQLKNEAIEDLIKVYDRFNREMFDIDDDDAYDLTCWEIHQERHTFYEPFTLPFWYVKDLFYAMIQRNKDRLALSYEEKDRLRTEVKRNRCAPPFPKTVRNYAYLDEILTDKLFKVLWIWKRKSPRKYEEENPWGVNINDNIQVSLLLAFIERILSQESEYMDGEYFGLY